MWLSEGLAFQWILSQKDPYNWICLCSYQWELYSMVKHTRSFWNNTWEVNSNISCRVFPIIIFTCTQIHCSSQCLKCFFQWSDFSIFIWMLIVIRVLLSSLNPLYQSICSTKEEIHVAESVGTERKYDFWIFIQIKFYVQNSF